MGDQKEPLKNPVNYVIVFQKVKSKTVLNVTLQNKFNNFFFVENFEIFFLY